MLEVTAKQAKLHGRGPDQLSHLEKIFQPVERPAGYAVSVLQLLWTVTCAGEAFGDAAVFAAFLLPW